MILDDAPELPALTPELVEDEELLASAVDEVVRLDPVAAHRAAEIVEHQGWLRDVVDADTWKLVLEIDARQTERWADVVVRVVAWAFEEGRRYPVAPTGEEDGS